MSVPAQASPGLVLRLYVAGPGPNSQAARTNLDAVLVALGLPARVEVIDVLAHPSRAQAARVLVTPTLERLSPGPEARLLGTLADRDALRRLLEP